MTKFELPILEAVYYATPVPRSKANLTVLGLVFDRIHFPHVSVPLDGYDPEATAAEVRRLEALPRQSYDLKLIIGAMRLLPHAQNLTEFCSFTGGSFGVFDGSAAAALANTLRETLYGKPPPGFIPTETISTTKGLPGGKQSVHYPGSFYYPAAALLYAQDHGLVVVNDDPFLPVPAAPKSDVRTDTALLSSMIALKCVELALPHVRPLSPARIVEVRDELRTYLQPFRRAVLRLSGELSKMLASEATGSDIQRYAELLVHTEVSASLAELEAAMARRPALFSLDNAMTAAVAVPTISAAVTGGLPSAVAAILSAAGLMLTRYRDQNSQRECARSSFYYLLQMERVVG